ncbi:MAG: hypothetical protein U9Q79_00420, partial [Candidatus Hydrogenedentes bacterium]|nr:hypothetical protein [Candidatus Hydrogenedentota bacterium]
MKEDPEALAVALRNEADLLLENSGLRAVLQGYGQPHLTGSYALDLMAWRVLDIRLVLFEMWDPLDAFFVLGHRIAKQRGVFRMTFSNHVRKPTPDLPGGLLWDIRVVNPDNDEEWKLALWAVDKAHVQQNDGLLERIREALDEESRRLILRLTHALSAKQGHLPFLSSLKLYEAVLFEGLRDEAAIRAYLHQR